MNQTSVTAVILSEIGEFNEGVAADQRIPETVEATLFGPGGELESLGLVNLIQMVEEDFGEKNYDRRSDRLCKGPPHARNRDRPKNFRAQAKSLLPLQTSVLQDPIQSPIGGR
jgi:hypothetical protein